MDNSVSARTSRLPLAAVVVVGNVVLPDEERVDLVGDAPHPVLHLSLRPGQEEPFRLVRRRAVYAAAKEEKCNQKDKGGRWEETLSLCIEN